MDGERPPLCGWYTAWGCRLLMLKRCGATSRGRKAGPVILVSGAMRHSVYSPSPMLSESWCPTTRLLAGRPTSRVGMWDKGQMRRLRDFASIVAFLSDRER